MKNRNFKIGALLVSLFAASCSPALYQSGTYNIDDMYAEHDVTRIAQEKQAIAEARKAEAEAHRAEIEARQAEAAYYASDDSYQGVLADTYESAYARRLRGFSSPTYQMPTSYFNLRYNGTYQFVSAYDPAVYNIIVMGDEVWVEPKYITSMFGTWGSPSIVSFGWSAGLYNDWYFSWGYNPYPWAYPGFGWPYYSYNPYWGYPYWGGYYPTGVIIPAGEAAITTTRTRRTIGPTSYTALPTGTDRERDRTSDRPVSEGAARVV